MIKSSSDHNIFVTLTFNNNPTNIYATEHQFKNKRVIKGKFDDIGRFVSKHHIYIRQREIVWLKMKRRTIKLKLDLNLIQWPIKSTVNLNKKGEL